MATIDDLAKSLSEMTEGELFELIRQTRQRRRTPQAKKSSKTRKPSKDPLAGLTPEMAKKLMEQLGE